MLVVVFIVIRINYLTSLVSCPIKVGGNFTCSQNKLISLVGCPSSVGGDFDCSENEGLNDAFT